MLKCVKCFAKISVAHFLNRKQILKDYVYLQETDDSSEWVSMNQSLCHFADRSSRHNYQGLWRILDLSEGHFNDWFSVTVTRMQTSRLLMFSFWLNNCSIRSLKDFWEEILELIESRTKTFTKQWGILREKHTIFNYTSYIIQIWYHISYKNITTTRGPPPVYPTCHVNLLDKTRCNVALSLVTLPFLITFFVNKWVESLLFTRKHRCLSGRISIALFI